MLGYDKAILLTNYWKYCCKKNALVKRTVFRSGAMIFDRNTAA